jgi:hypothetical protein
MSERLRTITWSVLLLLGVMLVVAQLRGEDLLHRGVPAHGHTHAAGSAHEPRRLFVWEPEEAGQLELEAGGQTAVFRRAEEGWRQLEPPGAGALAIDAAAYVALLSQARKDREFESSADGLHAFGLAPERVRVVVLDSAGETLADMKVGAPTPDGFGRYVHMGDEQVLIVPHYQFEPVFQLFSVPR